MAAMSSMRLGRSLHGHVAQGLERPKLRGNAPVGALQRLGRWLIGLPGPGVQRAQAVRPARTDGRHLTDLYEVLELAKVARRTRQDFEDRRVHAVQAEAVHREG